MQATIDIKKVISIVLHIQNVLIPYCEQLEFSVLELISSKIRVVARISLVSQTVLLDC